MHWRDVCHPVYCIVYTRCQKAECLHFCLRLETGERTGEASPCLMTDSQRRAKSGLTPDIEKLCDFDRIHAVPWPSSVKWSKVISQRYLVFWLYDIFIQTFWFWWDKVSFLLLLYYLIYANCLNVSLISRMESLHPNKQKDIWYGMETKTTILEIKSLHFVMLNKQIMACN